MPEALTKTQFLVGWVDTKSRFDNSPAESRFFHFWRCCNPPHFSSLRTLILGRFVPSSFQRVCALFEKHGGYTPKLPKMVRAKVAGGKSELKKVGLKEEKQLGFGT
jgi:hypothetical protein